MSGALGPVRSIDDLSRFTPLDRFRALIAGVNFAAFLRQEPIVFDIADPIYGHGCGVAGCAQPGRGLEGWCTRHGHERRAALVAGVGEAAWIAGAVGLQSRGPQRTRLPPCRFCPDRDGLRDELCAHHANSHRRARLRTGESFDEAAWAARQRCLPGVGPCRVPGCVGRAESSPSLCLRHRVLWRHAGQPGGQDLDRWLLTARDQLPGVVALGALPPLLEAEVRYGLWAHTKSAAPAQWPPLCLRTLVRSCLAAGVESLLDLDLGDPGWARQVTAMNRIVREMLKDVQAVHYTRADTRELGYIDTDYWGFRFVDRRSSFDLTAISQRWLRDLAWDYLADRLDGPRRPRRQGTFEQARRALVSFSAYLAEHAPGRGVEPTALNEATARGFAADFTRRAATGQPTLGMFNMDGSPAAATPTTYALSMNGLRRVMRWAMETGVAAAVGLPREFIVAIPAGGALSFKNPRPFSDTALRRLSDPDNIALLGDLDPNDGGLADMWSIQVRCGRRISEVIGLRFDCVSEHLARTWMWVDMTKVGKLDYAIQIPRDVYDLIIARQAKTAEKFRLKHGTEPTAQQRRMIALFPSRKTNPTFERSVSTSSFSIAFKTWIESEHMRLPGHTTHQARHTLATRLVNAGASMTHVKRVLGHVSERMSDSYVLIAGSQVEPFLQQVWVTGPGNPTPGRVVMTPTAAEKAAAEQMMIDLAALPTEHGLCTFKPVVGGHDCPFDRQCQSCEHFVLTGADYGYWRRQEQRWAAMAEGAPDQAARDYIYEAFERSSQALAGLEKALLALGLLDQARELDLRSPRQDFFDPIWTQGWRTGDLMHLGSSDSTGEGAEQLQDASEEEGEATTA